MNDYRIQSIIDYKDIANELFVFQIDNCDESMYEETRLISFYENVILKDVNEDEEKVLEIVTKKWPTNRIGSEIVPLNDTN